MGVDCRSLYELAAEGDLGAGERVLEYGLFMGDEGGSGVAMAVAVIVAFTSLGGEGRVMEEHEGGSADMGCMSVSMDGRAMSGSILYHV